MNNVSSLIILLNSLFVIPTDLNIANSCFLNSILVVIVFTMFVTPINIIMIMNPYKNIPTSVIKCFPSLYVS